MKKILSLVLAVMMIAVIGIAGASSVNEFNGGTTNGQEEDNANRSGESLGNSTTLKFEKAIKLVDADDKFFIPNVPNIVFTYTVAPVTVASETKVSDALTAAEVKTGVGSVTVTAVDQENRYNSGDNSGVKFINNSTANTIENIGTASEPVYIAKEFLNLDFSGALSAATEPGVYRYQITETAILKGIDANKGYDYTGDVIVTSGDTRIVDMYVKWNDAGTALQVYGYTMFKGTPSYSSTTVPAATLTAEKKTDGFTYDESTTTVTLDSSKTAENSRTYTTATDTSGMTTYTTYDLVIRKTVSGTMGEKTREFDIDVLISSLPDDDKVYYVAKDGTTYTTAAAAISGLKLTAAQSAVGGGATLSGTVSNNTYTANNLPTLKHDEYVVIKGIPSGNGSTTDTKYDVQENSTATLIYGYVMSYVHNVINTEDPTDSYTNIVANHGSIASGKSSLTATFDLVKTAGTNAFFVDNDLDAISPTGYVARFAPYALIMIAGIILLFVAKKRKPAEEE